MTFEPTAIDRLHSEFNDIVESIDPTELHLRNVAEETLRKTLLLAAASHFERELTNLIREIVRIHSGGAEVIEEFVQNKAIKRQYHTYFNWQARNANSFFGLFGKGFRSHMASRVRRDPNLGQAIQAFLELGRDRNLLVHEDFANFSIEKTRNDIFQRYTEERIFIHSIKSEFDQFAPSPSGQV